jgi:hypothetical protein
MTRKRRVEWTLVDAGVCGIHLVLCLLLAISGAAQAEDGLVLVQSDFPADIGTRTVYEFSSENGKSRGEAVSTVVESIRLGDLVLSKTVTTVNGNPLPPSWLVLSPERVQAYRGGISKEPEAELPLPLQAGVSRGVPKTMPGTGFVVEKEEALTLSAGTFRCLVCTWRRDGSVTEMWWIAPRVGIVQRRIFGDNPMTVTLVSRHKADSAPPPKHGALLLDFEPSYSSGPSLCPHANWKTYDSKQGAIWISEVDPNEGANGSKGSFRWSYHTEAGVWVQAGILLTGSWQERVDLTPYTSITFWLKGFRPGKCAFVINAAPRQKDGRDYVLIPLDYTTEWSKVTIDLGRDEMLELDLGGTVQLALGYQGQDHDRGNVIWLDEVICHKRSEADKKN